MTPHVMYKQGVIEGPQVQREVRSDSKSGSDVHFGVLFFVKYSYVSNGVVLPQKKPKRLLYGQKGSQQHYLQEFDVRTRLPSIIKCARL